MSDEDTARGLPGSLFSGHAPAVPISPDQFTLLMWAIVSSQTGMDDKFAKFQAEVRQGQEDAAAKALKRARYDRPYAFKQKGNEAQVAFNAKVDQAWAQAEDDIADIAPTPATTPAIQRLLETVGIDSSLIEERQKLIRLADRSEHGWGMVEEYTADDLAVDSDHERRV